MSERRYLVVDIGCFECADDLDEAVTPVGIRTGTDLVPPHWEDVGGYKRSTDADREGGTWAFPLDLD